jgi:osmoprotectant transport system substrate-binding protein
LRALAAVVSVGVAAAACASDDRVQRPPARTSDGAVVVASFDFAESEMLAEMYASALEEAGVPVRRELRLGPRELVLPALQQQHVDVVPEYLGTALATVDPATRVDRSDAQAVRDALQRALGEWDLRVLRPSPAQNQNVLVTTRRTARRAGVQETSDLRRGAPRLTLGGPQECPQRRYCLPGLRDVYGLRFRDFVPVVGAARVRRALDDGVIDVGVMFSTDGQLAAEDLVVLPDDRELQPVEHVVPVVSRAAVDRYGTRLVGALDAVSARLRTRTLRFLNWRVSVAGNGARAEARAWLVRHGLAERPR